MANPAAPPRRGLAAWLRHPVAAIVICLFAAALANQAVPHMHEVVHGIEAFTAAVAVWLVAGLAARLQRREQELRAEEERRQRAERIAALTSFAAGAAHELATPLGTISVAAKEMLRAAAQRGDAAAEDDARLIQEEVARCRAVLDQLSAEGGELAGEGLSWVSADQLVEAGLAHLSPPQRARVQVAHEAPDTAWHVPPRATAQVLAALVDNALLASDGADPVQVVFGGGPGVSDLLVADTGRGMTAAELSRAREPFFTTKPGDAAGRAGMGLGLFLAASFAERLDGSLDIESSPGAGTRVLMRVPRPEADRV